MAGGLAIVGVPGRAPARLTVRSLRPALFERKKNNTASWLLFLGWRSELGIGGTLLGGCTNAVCESPRTWCALTAGKGAGRHACGPLGSHGSPPVPPPPLRSASVSARRYPFATDRRRRHWCGHPLSWQEGPRRRCDAPPRGAGNGSQEGSGKGRPQGAGTRDRPSAASFLQPPPRAYWEWMNTALTL